LNKDTTDLIIRINSAGDDQEELERSTHQLREELLDMKLESVDLVKKGNPPKGSKAGEEVVSWGSLIVGLAASGGVLPNLVGTVQSWLSRRENQKITMQIGGDKLEVTGISNEQQDKLIDAWINRHKGG
jgi:Effector Associated Constant Component 1